VRNSKKSLYSEGPLVLISEQFKDRWEGCFTPEFIADPLTAPIPPEDSTHSSVIVDADSYCSTHLIDNSFYVVGFGFFTVSGVFKFEIEEKIAILQTHACYDDSFRKNDIIRFLNNESLDNYLLCENIYSPKILNNFIFDAFYIWKETEQVIQIELGEDNLIRTYEINSDNFNIDDGNLYLLHVFDRL
jgi:hypothetical protein